ncbi:MAG: CoA pyrophosphatase [Dehalococcoidia bacterium]|nr:CoA pyrophosphatase [Dehalococcoidia bacterium]
MPFYEKEGKLYLLFTKRTDRVAYHKSEISFPGGVQETLDRTLLQTALRESAEEIGLDVSTVEVLGALDDTPTVASKYVITPYVAVLNGPPLLTVNREEVEEVIELPFEVLLDGSNPRDERLVVDGVPRQVMAYRYDGHVIWGVTARVLKQFLDLVRPELDGLVGNAPACESDSSQPDSAGS